jgi:hypothetical protein
MYEVFSLSLKAALDSMCRNLLAGKNREKILGRKSPKKYKSALS